MFLVVLANGAEVGFDEYMNLVLDDAEEVNIKKKSRKQLGRILLKGDNITLMMNTRPTDSHSDSDDESALDYSSIRYTFNFPDFRSDSVRLIDEKQNMVGVVPKREALQMAEDAELDLVCSFITLASL
ncbi:LSM domain, eukaryotic/archaea-type [Dillenia turbinata]|uniref:Small nuclear ribonucleoprotein E n=1 Tax=Dillenia turbinata TaxID=194707 RepID=A0AAN8W641_9MAGN